MSYLVRVRLKLKDKSEREPPFAMHLTHVPMVGDRIELPYHGGALLAEVGYVWSPPKEVPEAIHDLDADQI